MIVSTETLSNVAQLNAARDAELADANSVRMESWARRYPHDLVEVPACTTAPSWPAVRSSIPKANNITKLKAGAGR